jgi:hypothetical protein
MAEGNFRALKYNNRTDKNTPAKDRNRSIAVGGI